MQSGASCWFLTYNIASAILNTSLVTNVARDAQVHHHEVFGRVAIWVKTADDVETVAGVDVDDNILKSLTYSGQRELLCSDAADIKSQI